MEEATKNRATPLVPRYASRSILPSLTEHLQVERLSQQAAAGSRSEKEVPNGSKLSDLTL